MERGKAPKIADLPPQMRGVIQSIAHDTGVGTGGEIPGNLLVEPVIAAISGRAVRELQSYLRIVAYRMRRDTVNE